MQQRTPAVGERQANCGDGPKVATTTLREAEWSRLDRLEAKRRRTNMLQCNQQAPACAGQLCQSGASPPTLCLAGGDQLVHDEPLLLPPQHCTQRLGHMGKAVHACQVLGASSVEPLATLSRALHLHLAPASNSVAAASAAGVIQAGTGTCRAVAVHGTELCEQGPRPACHHRAAGQQGQTQGEQQAGAAAVVARLPAPAAWRGACCPTHTAEGHPAWAAHGPHQHGFASNSHNKQSLHASLQDMASARDKHAATLAITDLKGAAGVRWTNWGEACDDDASMARARCRPRESQHLFTHLGALLDEHAAFRFDCSESLFARCVRAYQLSGKAWLPPSAMLLVPSCNLCPAATC
ncbi:hypothetical protein HaLaN_25837, partial [Haematococcus lacustris]